MRARAHAGSLVEYLRGFALTVAAMASPRAMERVAFEAVEDVHRDGCVLAEFRIAPILFEEHGIAIEAATEALLAGLARGSHDTGMPSGLIVCGMRQQDEAAVSRSADVALRYRDDGVVGFDLAGPEAGFPASLHARTLTRLRDAGLPLTLHAGEADRAERIIEAAELGAARIGHGVRLADAIGSPDRGWLVDAVRSRGLHLEVCPTSNVHTGAATSIETHPIRPLWDAGVDLSYHTDNRLISGVSMSSEAAGLDRPRRVSAWTTCCGWPPGPPPRRSCRQPRETARRRRSPPSTRRARRRPDGDDAARSEFGGGLVRGHGDAFEPDDAGVRGAVRRDLDAVEADDLRTLRGDDVHRGGEGGGDDGAEDECAEVDVHDRSFVRSAGGVRRNGL